jgi:hypothetical protein
LLVEWLAADRCLLIEWLETDRCLLVEWLEADRCLLVEWLETDCCWLKLCVRRACTWYPIHLCVGRAGRAIGRPFGRNLEIVICSIDTVKAGMRLDPRLIFICFLRNALPHQKLRYQEYDAQDDSQ